MAAVIAAVTHVTAAAAAADHRQRYRRPAAHRSEARRGPPLKQRSAPSPAVTEIRGGHPRSQVASEVAHRGETRAGLLARAEGIGELWRAPEDYEKHPGLLREREGMGAGDGRGRGGRRTGQVMRRKWPVLRSILPPSPEVAPIPRPPAVVQSAIPDPPRRYKQRRAPADRVARHGAADSGDVSDRIAVPRSEQCRAAAPDVPNCTELYRAA